MIYYFVIVFLTLAWNFEYLLHEMEGDVKWYAPTHIEMLELWNQILCYNKMSELLAKICVKRR